MIPSKLYSEPEIYPKHPKPADMNKYWFVNVRFYDVTKGKWIQKRFKKNINSFKRYKDRLADAQALKEVLKEQLDLGWNPLTGDYPEMKVDPLEAINDLSSMPFRKAIDFALAKLQGSVSERTYKNYKNSSKRIMKQASFVKIPGSDDVYDFGILPVDKIKKKHVKFLLDHCRSSFKWSNKAFNKHMGYYRAVLTRLVTDDIITGNPASMIKELPVKETKKFIPYTDPEKKIIREYLYLHNYGFFFYLMMIYHTGMRPNEVLALRVKDINMELGTITIIPDDLRDNSKTNSIRVVPLVGSLQLLIREWLSHDHSKDCYLFGSPFKAGRGNVGNSSTGRGAAHSDYFKPSMVRIKRDTVTRLWKKIVIDHLNIKKHLYAAKHTGADDKIMAGIDIEALKELYGHESKYMTMNYVTKLKEIHQKQIKELSPEF